MTGRFRQALLEKGKMPKKFSVKSGDKSAAGGLTAKGVKRYRAANPGSKLKTAVTTKPSKLKKGSKSAKRRKSFCARMGGMKKRLTSAKTRRDPDSRINKALRKWNCSTDANPNALQQIAEMVIEAMADPKSKPAKVAARNVRAGYAGKPRAMQQRRADHEARRGVRKARAAMAEAILKRGEPSFRDRVRKRTLQGDSRTAAVSKEALAQKDKKVRDAQGKNTMSSTFGQKGTQTSTTAYGGGGGSEEDRTPPMSRKQIDRSGSSTAKKATPKQTRAANMKLMKDMGALKFDDKGRRVKN
jgi:hypothetical protein